MQLISVNLGSVQPITVKIGVSGIFKQPTSEPVAVTKLGLQGDAIADLDNHGGVDQAVYIYTVEDYDWWANALGRALAPGTFGENLTIAGLESAGVVVGTCFHISGVILQATAPRTPCMKLATRMDDPEFVKKFTQAARPGIYCRVLREGTLRAGDSVSYTPYEWDKIPHGERITMLDLRYNLAREKSDDELRRLLRAPIAVRARDYYEQLLAERAEMG